MDSSTRANILVAAFAGSWAVAGAVEKLLAESGRTPNEAWLAHTIALGILAFAWCKAHAAARGLAVPAYAPLMAGLMWPVGVPVYLFRALPWRAALVSFAKAVAVFLLCAALYWVGSLGGGSFAAKQFVQADAASRRGLTQVLALTRVAAVLAAP